MADEGLRRAEREWREHPQDQAALCGYVDALYRAGLPVTHELLEQRVLPARRFDLPIPCTVSVALPNGEALTLGRTPHGGTGLDIPAHRALWVRPDIQEGAIHRLLRAIVGDEGVHGLGLIMRRNDEVSPAKVLWDMSRAPFTHLWFVCEELIGPRTLAQVAAAPRLAWMRYGVDAVVSAESLENMSGSNLTRFELSARRLDPGALGALKCGRLTHLEASEGSVGVVLDNPDKGSVDAELVELAAGTVLRHLDLERAWRRQPTDAGLAAIAERAPQLQCLKLVDSSAITDGGIQALARLALEELGVGSELITDLSGPVLGGIPLKRLRLSASMGPSGLVHLPKSLEELSTTHPPGPASWLSRLSELRKLTLSLSEGTVDDDLAALAELSSLEYLWIAFDDSGVATSRVVQHVSHCRRLSALWLVDVPELDSSTFSTLLSLPLRDLALEGNYDDSVERLATHQTVERLILRSDQLGLAGLRALSRAPSLKVLRVDDCPQVTVDELRQIARERPGVAVLDDMDRIEP